MLKTMKKTTRIFIIRFSRRSEDMLRVHNSTNMEPIITYFQGRFKFMKRHNLVILSIHLNVLVKGRLHLSRFFHTKKGHIDMCSYIISVVYICRIISCLKGNAYVAGNLLKIINAKNEVYL